MHARVGLRTPYLGQDRLTCARACVEAARERGMGAWLYDEDKWPSGFAGGLSVAAQPDLRAQALVCKVDNRPALLAERIATFAARSRRATDRRPPRRRAGANQLYRPRDPILSTDDALASAARFSPGRRDVDGTGRGVQSAVNTATSGDTILAADGTCELHGVYLCCAPLARGPPKRPGPAPRSSPTLGRAVLTP